MRRTVLATFAVVCAATAVEAQSLSADDLARRTIERRAVEAVIWGMPAVNTEIMMKGLQGKGDFNQILYWSRLPDWKNQLLTPNPDTIYFLPFYNTKDVGPMVLEIPPATAEDSITGSVDDAWQVALEDVGPAGVDKGKGGKYLILPPGYAQPVPAGYIPMRSDTHTGFGVLRANIRSTSDVDVAKAVAYGKRVKFYPLAQAVNPPATTFVDFIDTIYDNTIPYDLSFFKLLDRFVQREPWLPRDRAMIDMLKSIGIEKGKPFNPDAKTEEILKAAAREAQAWLDMRYEQTIFSSPFYEGTRWNVSALPETIHGMSTNFADINSYPVDSRGVTYSYAIFSAKHLGEGQFYLMTIQDKDGRAFDGSRNYRLHVPANVPVRLYWSLTLYDRVTHAYIRELSHSSRSSQVTGLQKNPDGSVDIYIGPKVPRGQGNELDFDESRRALRGDVALLRSGEGVLRQILEAGGH